MAYAYLAPAYSYRATRDWQRVMDAAQAAIRIKPDFAEAYRMAGLAAVADGSVDFSAPLGQTLVEFLDA